MRAGSACDAWCGGRSRTSVAILGIDAYRTAFDDPRAAIGRQQAGLGDVLLWVLPNPSGLNAHFQLPQLSAAFAELRRAIAMR